MFDTLRQVERTKDIITVLLKNGFDDIVSAMGIEKYLQFSIPKNVQSSLHLSRSVRIRKTIEGLGPTFIKMAQILSTRPDLISLELADEFSKLQDNVEAIPFEIIKPRFVEEFGKDVDEIFETELVLVASASLGQVYKGRLKSGEDVAVKILRPGTQKMIYSDIEIIYHLASLLENKLGSYGIHSPKKIVQEFEKSIKKELDYNAEALNLKLFIKNFDGNKNILVPKLYEEFSCKSVLTMQYIEGIKVTDTKKLKEIGIEPKEIAQRGFNLLCEQIFIHRFFHADPHPGNIFVLEDGHISFVDFGMMGSIAERDRKYFVDMIYYITKEEEEKAAFCILELSKVQNDNLDEDAFAKDMGDVIRTYFYGSLNDIKIKNLLNDIVTLMSRYRVYFRENNYLLVKALMTIEGVGKELDPDFNASVAIKPFVIQFYKKNFSFMALLSKVGEIPKELGDFLMQFPQDIKAITQKMKSGKLKIEFQHIGLEDIQESMERSLNRLSIAVVIAAILIGSSLLLLAKTPPLLFGIPILGLAGFVTAVFMGMVLIYSIFKKGKF